MEGATQRCSRCGLDLPHSAFSPSRVRAGTGWCNACVNERRRDKRAGRVPARVTDVCLGEDCDVSMVGRRTHAKYCSPACAVKAWRTNNPELRRAYYIKCQYGITLAEYEAILVRQEGLCAICRKAPEGQWNVDHCHATGAVRGMLCSNCNWGIGHFGDNPDLMRQAAKYVEAARLTA